MLPAALDDEATGHGAGRTASISPARGQYGNQAGAAAEATPAQEEPGRLPAQERRTWFFRGMIALLSSNATNAAIFSGVSALTGTCRQRRPSWVSLLTD